MYYPERFVSTVFFHWPDREDRRPGMGVSGYHQYENRRRDVTMNRESANVLSVAGLRRTYGERVAVDGISFEVNRNEIVGLLGPNGAGKTTTINMILGVLEPSSGSIRIEGEDVTTNRTRALERTNFAAVYAPLPGNLTVQQNLRVFGMMYGVNGIAERIESLLVRFD